MDNNGNEKPVVRIRVSTDFQASTKRIEPDVTVEIALPNAPLRHDRLDESVALAREAAIKEFTASLIDAEAAIRKVRP